MQQRDLAAERVQHAGELDGDVAAADDGDAPRQLLELEEPVRRDPELGAGHGRQLRPAAGRDHDVLRPIDLAVRVDDLRRACAALPRHAP